MKLNLILLTLMSFLSCSSNSTSAVLSPAEFQQALTQDNNAILIDIRKPEEFDAGHLVDAININWLDTPKFKEKAAKLDKKKPLYIYCQSGRRSAAANQYLTGQGFKVVEMKGGFLAWQKEQMPYMNAASDMYQTASGKKIVITPIMHGTLMLNIDGRIIHIDPVGMFGTNYSLMPKADVILVSHEHPDHYDLQAIKAIMKEGTLILSNKSVAEQSQLSQPFIAGETIQLDNATAITATEAYNTSAGHTQFHPKGHGIGFIIECDGTRIYIAGDTEPISEMKQMDNIDIAFLPVNQPFTMTPEQCIEAIEMIHPQIVYPYHYGETDLTPIINSYKDKETRIIIKNLQ